MFSRELLKIFQIVKENGGTLLLVGGAVRDFLLLSKPIESGDVDLSVNLPPEVVTSIFKKLGIKVILKYMTNTVIINKRVFEITSTRKDEFCDGRYAKMVFTPSFEEDSGRRDFTINALYMKEDGEILDFHNGLNDLKNNSVRFIGRPERRIEEDYLRIWRFFRFSCIYSNDIDKAGYKGCIAHKAGLKKISKERITMEMFKLLAAKPARIKFILNKMVEGNILKASDFFITDNLPDDVFLRLIVLSGGVENTEFLYTTKQKKVLHTYKSVKEKLRDKKYLYFLYYTLDNNIFKDILTVAIFLGHVIDKSLPDFSSLPTLPFSAKDIILEGFQGRDISVQFKKKLEDFIDTL